MGVSKFFQANLYKSVNFGKKTSNLGNPGSPKNDRKQEIWPIIARIPEPKFLSDFFFEYMIRDQRGQTLVPDFTPSFMFFWTWLVPDDCVSITKSYMTDDKIIWRSELSACRLSDESTVSESKNSYRASPSFLGRSAMTKRVWWCVCLALITSSIDRIFTRVI